MGANFALLDRLMAIGLQRMDKIYDEVYNTFDNMGLQENLLRGIYAYGK